MDHLGSWSRNKYLQRDLLELLGTMQTHSPEAIQILVIQIRDQETYTSDAAIEALVRVGEPSAAALEAEFPNLEEPYKQIRILKIFRLWGHAARPHLPWLRARLADTQSPLVKDALEDTIEAISQ